MSSTCYQLTQQWSWTAAGTFNYLFLQLIPGGSSTSVGGLCSAARGAFMCRVCRQMYSTHTGSYNIGTCFFFFFFFLEPYHWNYIGNEIQIYIFYRFEIFIILEDRDWCMHVRSPGFFMFVTCHTVAKMWSLQMPLHACGCFFCTVMHFDYRDVAVGGVGGKKGKREKRYAL